MADVVKTTIFYADVDDFARLNEVYARHMPDPPPARSAPANVVSRAAYSSRSKLSRSCRAPRPASQRRRRRSHLGVHGRYSFVLPDLAGGIRPLARPRRRRQRPGLARCRPTRGRINDDDRWQRGERAFLPAPCLI